MLRFREPRFTINRRKAAEIGLNVEKPSGALYGLLSQIIKSYETELATFQPFSFASLLGTQGPSNFQLVRGLVESSQECYGFVTVGKVALNPNGQQVDHQTDFEGWKKLP